MTPRLLAVALAMLPAVLGAHLTGLLLGVFAVLAVTARVAPLIATVALVGAVLILSARITLTIRQTWWGRGRSFA